VASDMPTLPSPSTWSAGEYPTTPQLRSDVANAVDLLTCPPAFSGGQLVTTQSIPASGAALTGVLLDAEFVDEWNGHRQNSKEGAYYAPLAGYYLLEGGAAFPSASSGMCAAGFQYQSGGSSTASVGAQRVPLSSAHNTVPAGAKIIAQSDILPWGTGDFIGLACHQTSSGALALVNAPSQYPYFTSRWVCALTGTEPLPVPVNAAFPAPPAALGHVFMNTNIRDTINFLIYPPVFEGQYNAGTATLPSAVAIPSTGTLIGMDTVNVDTYGGYSTSSRLYTAPVAGVYFTYFQAALTMGSGASALAAGITVHSANYNGGTAFTIWGGTQAPIASQANVAIVRRRLRLNAGDTLQAAAWQHDSGSAAATILGSGLWTSRFITAWESA
jgi:hypothetical protein